MILNQSLIRLVCQVCLGLCISASPSLALAQPADIRLTVEQRSSDGVNVNYGLRVDSSRLFFGPLPGQLIAPDGTNFSLFSNSASNLSFQELGNRFFGNWTIAERTFSGNANHTYFFNGFALMDVLSEIPTIVAPVRSGQSAVVDTPFQVAWEFPSGATPSGQVATSSGSGGRIAFTNFTPNSVLATPTLDPGVTQAELNISAGSTSSLSNYLSGVTRDPSGLGSNWSLQGTFFNLSPPIRVTVVPEPNGLLAINLGLACWLLRRRR
jgi:hypothetical protein